MEFKEFVLEGYFHGSPIDNLDKIGLKITGKQSLRGIGLFFSSSYKYAKQFGFVYICNIKLNKPKIYETSSDFARDDIRFKGTDNLFKQLKDDNYDGIIIKKSKVLTGIVEEIICFYETSVKSIKKIGSSP